MLAGEDKVCVDLLPVGSWVVAFSAVVEGLAFVDLDHFLVDGFLPEVVAIVFVKLHGLVVGSRNLNTTHAYGLVPEGMKLGFVGHADQALMGLGVLLDER